MSIVNFFENSISIGAIPGSYDASDYGAWCANAVRKKAMTMSRNIAFIALIATLITSPTFVGGAAQAAPEVDGAVYPGTFCQPSHSTDDISYGPNGILLMGKPVGSVSCPIVRDLIAADRITNAYIVIVAGSKSDSTCSLRAITSSGEISVTAQPASTVTLSGNLKKLEYKTISTSPQGPYLFHCALHRGESVFNYYVEEVKP